MARMDERGDVVTFLCVQAYVSTFFYNCGYAHTHLLRLR